MKTPKTDKQIQAYLDKRLEERYLKTIRLLQTENTGLRTQIKLLEDQLRDYQIASDLEDY